MTSLSEFVRKRWPRLERAAQLDEVVDLAKAHDPDRVVFIGDRLVAAGQVDDAQPPGGEADPGGREKAVAVGDAVSQQSRHPFQQ